MQINCCELVSHNPIRFTKSRCVFSKSKKQTNETTTKTRDYLSSEVMFRRLLSNTPYQTLPAPGGTALLFSIHFLRFLKAILPNNRYLPCHTHAHFSGSPYNYRFLARHPSTYNLGTLYFFHSLLPVSVLTVVLAIPREYYTHSCLHPFVHSVSLAKLQEQN